MYWYHALRAADKAGIKPGCGEAAGNIESVPRPTSLST
jgi:hypothetical protein